MQDYARLLGNMRECSPKQADSAMRSEAWVSIDTIAQHLYVSTDTVYRGIDQRGMPAHKAGRQWKFKIT